MVQKNIPNNESQPEQFVFGKINYRFMLISIAIVVAGFMLMIGESDIYDFRKTILAPIVVLAGFAVGFYAILKKPGKNV
ncbi:DUF3098 domain-containing protein [Daejeonella oryzae]|uniref:DUF3098 domain-containing protein n=1 Tax=Daejeonella oryzae TaxID=1122943 RepID=UPI0004169E7F|nr:DUF3098 domain-containing protein [Daejeonella oryzae]